MDHFNTIETSTETQTHHKFIKKTLVILAPLSLLSFLASYFLYYNPQLSYPTSSILDRKYMFLVCTGILAILSKNFKLSSHDSNDGGNAEDVEEDHGFQQTPQLPEMLNEVTSQENEPSNDEYHDDDVSASELEEDTEAKEMEELRQEQKYKDQWEEEEEDDDDGYEEDVEESVGVEGASMANEEISDLRVSTEELNKKFEEFIRKMKEELRIEALQQQQQLIAV